MQKEEKIRMKWEYLGKQEMKTPPGMFGYEYKANFHLWRSWIPGGWFICTANPTTGAHAELVFYPDPEHFWTGKEEEETDADYLLRPAGLLPPAPEKLE